VGRLVPRQYQNVIARIDAGPESARQGLVQSQQEACFTDETRVYARTNSRLELFFKLGFHLSKIGSMLALLW
jgi:hypothetical protein